jgi:hypothetical protein
VNRRLSAQPFGALLLAMVGTVAACSLLAPDDDELISERVPSGGTRSDSGTEGAGAGGASSGNGGASSGNGGASSGNAGASSGNGGSGGIGGADGAGGSSGAGEGGFGGSAGFGVAGKGGTRGGIDGVPGCTGGTDGGSAPIPTAGLVLWLKADAGVTAAGGLVAEWRDQSGNGHHATQAQAAAQPSVASQWRAGKPAIRFDGAQDSFGLPPMRFGDFSQGVSLFVVADTTGSSSCMPFIQFSNGDEANDVSFYRDPNGGLTYEVEETFAVCQNSVFPLLTPLAAAVVQAPSGAATVFVGNQSCTAETIDPPASVIRNDASIGRVPYPECSTFAGNIAELLVYRRAVSDIERSSISSYLAARWAL